MYLALSPCGWFKTAGMHEALATGRLAWPVRMVLLKSLPHLQGWPHVRLSDDCCFICEAPLAYCTAPFPIIARDHGFRAGVGLRVYGNPTAEIPNPGADIRFN